MLHKTPVVPALVAARALARARASAQTPLPLRHRDRPIPAPAKAQTRAPQPPAQHCAGPLSCRGPARQRTAPTWMCRATPASSHLPTKTCPSAIQNPAGR